ncbi:MAG: hypothetical protein ABEN55_08395 [Bradymonadaceae bacterium]
MGRHIIGRMWIIAGFALVGLGCSDGGAPSPNRPEDTGGGFVDGSQSAGASVDETAEPDAPGTQLSRRSSTFIPRPQSLATIRRRQKQAGPAFDVERETDGELLGTARNSAHPFSVDFSPAHPWIRQSSPDDEATGHSPWRLGLHLARIGRGDRMRPAPAVESRAVEGNRVAYRRGKRRHLEEWYLNGPVGLEQGVRITDRPAGPVDAPLILEMAIEGTLQPVEREDGTIALEDGEGRTTLVYRDLFVRDADGEPVSARMAVSGGRIRLIVDDAGASYPIEVDPTIASRHVLTSNAGGA